MIFEVDGDGILKVSAKTYSPDGDHNDVTHELTIAYDSYSLPEDEVDALIQKAEQEREAEKQK